MSVLIPLKSLQVRVWNYETKKMIYGFTPQEAYSLNNAYVMQALSKVDKHGKTIYEGDWLGTSNENPAYDFWNIEDEPFTLVYWNSDQECFRGTTWDWCYPGDNSVYDMEHLSVVGNMFENPELS